MDILFIGTASVIPEANRDTACCIINENVMLDCGWWGSFGMQRFGLNPMSVEHLLITHCHHDHYAGLPHLLYYKGRSPQESKEKKLHVWGPAAEIAATVELSCKFLKEEQYPNVVPEIEVHPVHPGDTFNLGVLKVSTCASIHPVPGLCYRFDDPTGASAVFSGDTAYNQDLIKLSRGADVLVHEVSYGAQAPDHNPSGHSGGKEAALTAKEAGVRLLKLINTSEARRREALASAKAIFHNASFAHEGERLLWVSRL